jgi:hypothetical protein
VARQGVAKSVEEDRLIGRPISNQREEDIYGSGPDWTAAHLAALTSNSHVPDLASGHVQISDEKSGSLRDASPGIIEEQQERVIAHALWCPVIRGG